MGPRSGGSVLRGSGEDLPNTDSSDDPLELISISTIPIP